jgi:exodeoxyribonuclease V gamma subunit
VQSRLEAWLAHPGTGRAKPAEAVLRLSLADLRRWLECPLTGAAAVRLGLRSQDLEDRAAVEDERFESAFLDTHGLLREVTLAASRTGRDCAEVYDAAVHHLQARGEAPFGVFADRERRVNLQPVRTWLELLDGARPATWRLGASRTAGGQADHGRPPLELTVTVAGRPLRVELVGELQPQVWQGSLFLETGKLPGKKAPALQKKALKAYLDHLVLACVADHSEHQAWFLCAGEPGKGGAILRYAFAALDGEAARAILGEWVRDLLEGDHAVLLPIEAVLDQYYDGTLSEASIRDFVDEKSQGAERGGSFSTLYGPVPDPLRWQPPTEPQALVEARLGGFLAQVRELVDREPS